MSSPWRAGFLVATGRHSRSTGLPLEFREFRLTGVIPSMDAFGEAFATQTPVPFVTEGAGVYRNRTPVGVDILDLP